MPGAHSASALPPLAWFFGHCMSPPPVMVPTWHCMGAPGFCAVSPSKMVFWMVRLGDPKMAAPNMLAASHTLSAKVQLRIVPSPPNRAMVAPTPAVAWLP
jgi:hypothetical protein